MGANSSDVIAGGASVRIGADDSLFLKGITAAEKRLKAFGEYAVSLGAKLSAVGIGLATGLVAAAKSFADAGSKIDDISQRTGDTAENISSIGYAAQVSGSSIEELEGAFSKMSGVIAGALAGEKSAVKLLDDLGLSAGDLQGKLPTEQLEIFADKLSEITDRDTKADMVKAIFGKSGTQLIPLLNEGSAGIEKLRAEAERLGLVMSTKDAQAAAALGDSFDNLYGAIGGLVNVIGGTLAPALTGVVNYLVDATASIGKFISENKSLIVSLAAAAASMVAAGAAISALGVVSYVTGAAITVLSGIVSTAYTAACGIATVATVAFSAAVNLLTASFAVLTSPLTLSIAAIAAVGAAAIHAMGGFEAFGQAMRSALSGAAELFNGLLATATATFGGISAAINAGNIQGAIDILWAGIRVAWQQGTDAINSTWDASLIYLEGALDSAVNGMEHVFAGFQTAFTIGITSIEGAFDTAVAYIRGAWATGLAYLSAGLDKFVTFATKAMAEVGFKARELKVAISPMFGKAAAYENINNDRQKLAAKLDEENKKRAAERQSGIDTAFDVKGREQRGQERNNRVAASGDTRASDAAFAENKKLRQMRLEGLGGASDKLQKLQEELSALVAKAAEGVKPTDEQISKGQAATEAGKQIGASTASPGIATRGSSEAVSSIIRSINTQRNPNAGVEAKLEKAVAVLNDIAKKTGFTVEEITL